MNSLSISLAAMLLSMTALGQGPGPPAGYYDPYGPGGYAYPMPPNGVTSDLAIRNNLNRAFFEDQLLNSVGMRAQVSNGVVTLRGRADNQEDVGRAIWHAYNAGAQFVINQLRVGP